ncbi:wyosine [tRNA(Phe)-imidazoG37] synthetase (radical SAM superfamily) [Kitasatospora sp. MAP12-15]|uniref:radical SAM protein n=1 Tax=unclassified Kitasatospora TaxID=2633591 RepID=UPI002475B1B5|nr:radical SAM protein [Kitasatospora sp. MAP12-44]MDH6113586.1 wyosine [tRNA(Phe)-imidazoG37] synthetase (radical SAM superfamily) [Kitasatospora sp. MAP12-44]
MTMLDIESPEQLPGAREAFHEYCLAVLGSILESADLIGADGSARHPSAYRLRCRDLDSAVDYGIGESRPLRQPLGRLPGSTADPLRETLDALLGITIPENSKVPLFAADWQCPDGASAGSWDHAPDTSGDFVFSYPIPKPGPTQATEATAGRADYPAQLLSALLDEVDLLEEGRAVYPVSLRSADGEYALFLRPVAEPHPMAERTEDARTAIRRQPLFSVSQTEPTIPVLARHWALLANLLRVSKGGDATVLDGFRLRHTVDWVVPSHGHPSEVYEHLARICNVACSFCYLFGNPDTLAIARAKKSIARDELDTRLAYYRPHERRALFSAQWELNEFLVDPRLPEIMRTLRQATDRPFFFTTNGNPLTPRIVEQLAEVKPVHFVVSTNTVDEPLRQEVMKEKPSRTWTALHCLQELRKHEIPFGVSLVATPDFPLDDLTRTVEAVSELDPNFIRINEPGFTRSHPSSMDFDTDVLWGSVIEWTQRMREQTSVPVIAIPSAYEENFFYDDPLAARVIGTVPGSPAAACDLRPGDVIVKVGFLEPKTRSEVVSALMLVKGLVRLQVRRGGRLFETTLDTDLPMQYPYTGSFIGKYIVPHGVVTAPSISAGDAKGIAAQIEDTGARHSWLVTSSLMLPAARAFIERYLPDYADGIDFVVATNDYLGGNIRVMDMCTIGDINAALVRRYEQVGRKPDLILVPATGFNAHGRDLVGRHWGDLERFWSVPVRLLGHTTQFVF